MVDFESQRPRLRMQANLAAHREEIRVKDAACRAARQEEIRVKKAAYYAAHREEARVKNAAYQASHRKEIRAYQAAHREEAKAKSAAWYVSHREERAAYRADHLEETRAYRADHRAELKAYNAAWYADHRGERKAKNAAHREERRAREKKKYKTNINYRLASCLRRRLRYAIKNGQKVGSAVRDLGCSIPQLITHIEWQFTEGMTWDNYGRGGWHLDHVKPLVLFDLTDREQFLKACHFTNLQPLWAVDNLSKQAKYEVDTQ